MDANDIADYVGSNVVDTLSRVPGVGNIQVFGGKYAMRIWLDPNKLHTYKLSVDEVTAAITAQNAQVAIGQLGGAPSVKGQQLNATINAQDRLQTPEQFRNILVRGGTDGSELRLGDVARVELGAESYDFVTRYNGKPSTGIAITLATGANALATAEGVRTALDEMKSSFPAGLETVVPYDTTPFVQVSIKGVIKTLIEAIVLVFVVMYLFLQNFRATLIPTIAVPVVLLGTFGVLAMLGFSVNMLTMFAMVLAIGLLVDDAIVVVENVERIMSEEGLSPLEATRKSMSQITGALVGIGLVLSAVFVPMAFMSGSTGIIYSQFSATIGHRADPGAVRDHAQAAEEGRAPCRPQRPAGPLLQRLQPRLRPFQRDLPARREGHHPSPVALHGHLRRPGRGDGRAVRAPAQLVPAQ